MSGERHDITELDKARGGVMGDDMVDFGVSFVLLGASSNVTFGIGPPTR